MSKIYLIHPIDENLQFLKKTIHRISSYFPPHIIYLKLQNNNKSHIDCLSAILNSSDKDLLCFFCHGRTDGLLGCKYRADYPTHRKKYEHGPLIDSNNIEIFRNKRIFCLACNSNEVGRIAVEAGARVFLGFNEININNCSNIHVKALTKFILGNAISDLLRIGIKNNFTFYQLADYLKLIINKRNDELILTHKGKKGYRKFYLASANILHEIKEGIRVLGAGNTRLND